MTIARLRLGHRRLSFSIGLEPANQHDTPDRLEARFQREIALQAHDQRRSDLEAQVFHLGLRPV